MPAELLPHSLAETEGPAYWFLNSLNIVKATTESTGGAYSMTWHTAPPGHATPYHLHHIEDEAFYVLDGEFTFVADGKKTILGPGGYILLPRGIPHGIRCTGASPAGSPGRARWPRPSGTRRRRVTGLLRPGCWPTNRCA